MSAGSASLVVPGPSRLHAVPAHVKTVGAALIVTGVVATPAPAAWAFAGHAAVLAALAHAGRVPLGIIARRLTVGLPVLAFAALLAWFGRGDRVEVLGLASLSRPGLLAAWNVVAKSGLGLATVVLLVATTSVPALVRGLERLRLPAVVVTITGLMLRYVDVIADDLRRMQVARVSRADDPRWIGQAGAVAATLGTVFVRTYERGERVHLAMVCRGYDASVRTMEAPPASFRDWATGLCAAVLVGALAAIGHVAA